MDVRKVESESEPNYPTAQAFVRSRCALGAALLGAGMTLSSCDQPRRTGGVPLANPAKQVLPSGAKTGGDEPRLGGKIRVEPKPEESVRLPGDVMVKPKEPLKESEVVPATPGAHVTPVPGKGS